MNRRSIRVGLVAIFVIGLATSSFAQGLHWTSVTKGGPMGERNEEMWVIPKKMKIVTNETGETIIIRLDKELFVMTDPKETTYSEITFAEMENTMKQAGGKMDAQMAEMEKQLAGMSDEQRKMVEQMMGNRMPGMAKEVKMEVEKTNEVKKISGFGCTKYAVSQDGKEVMTVWATKDVSGFDAMRKDWEELSKRMMSMNPMVKGIGEAFGKIDGFPILTQKGRGMTSTVTMVEKKTAAASEFEVPDGYKKVKSKMMEGMDKLGESEED